MHFCLTTYNQTPAQNDSIHQVAIDFGVDEEQLRVLMNTHIIEENLNEFGRYDNLQKTADTAKAKAYFETQEGNMLPPFKVCRMMDSFMRKFILG